MLAELLLFFTSIALGMTLRVLYFLLSLLAKSTRLKAVCYVLDVIWCAFAFGAFAALTVFLGGGNFETFTVMGILAGLGIGSLVFMAFSRKGIKEVKSKEREAKEKNYKHTAETKKN